MHMYYLIKLNKQPLKNYLKTPWSFFETEKELQKQTKNITSGYLFYESVGCKFPGL